MTTPYVLPSRLYHGTKSDRLPDIAAKGILPRSISGASNWEHTVESNPDAVYLTSAYALHYGVNSEGEGLSSILEIDTAKLDASLFAADEDGVAQLKEGRTLAGESLTLGQATAWWRERIKDVAASTSMKSIGNCTYFGVVPPEAISRVLVIQNKEAARLILQACDPVIAVANFRYMGEKYQRFSDWLFDHNGQPWSEETRPVVAPLDMPASLKEAAEKYKAGLNSPA